MKRTSPIVIAHVAADIHAGLPQDTIVKRHRVSSRTVTRIRKQLRELKARSERLTPKTPEQELARLRKENQRLRTTIRILKHHAATRTISV